MEIFVDRFLSNDDATLSKWELDGKYICFGLEDEPRAFKIPKETRIPSGRYKIAVRNFGGFNQRYSKKFPELHQGMLEIMDVPNFTDILIHIGNTDEHTAGCLLVGSYPVTVGEFKIAHSELAYKHFYSKVIDAAVAGTLFITIVDND